MRLVGSLAELVAAPAGTIETSAVDIPTPETPAYRRRFSLGRR